MGRLFKRFLIAAALSLVGSATSFGQRPELVIQRGHTSYVTSIAFSGDSRILASGARDGELKLWDVDSGKELRTLTTRSPQGAYLSVAFSPNGRTLASGGGDGNVRVWDVVTGQLKHTVVGRGGEILSIIFSHDGKLLASGGEKGVTVWDLSVGREIITIEIPWVSVVRFGPDSKTLNCTLD